jgi:hypothetical protein
MLGTRSVDMSDSRMAGHVQWMKLSESGRKMEG